MRILSQQAARLIAATAGLLGTLCSGSAFAEQDYLGVDDMLNIATIGDSELLGWRGSPDRVSHLSPDGRRVVLVLQRGHAREGELEGSLLLYDTRSLLSDPKATTPKILASFRSRTNFQPIAAVRWVDSNTLLFAAVEGEKPMQVYRLDVETGDLAQISREEKSVAAFATSDDGKSLLTLTFGDQRPAKEDPECLRKGCLVSGGRLTDVINGGGESVLYPGNLSFYANGERRELRSLYSQDIVRDCAPNDFIPGGLSPNGRFALFFCSVEIWPDWWGNYSVNERFSEMMAIGNADYAHQYILIDTLRNELRPLTSAPFLRSMQIDGPVWIDGGKKVLLVGAVEPLANVDGDQKKTRTARLGVIEVDPLTGETSFEITINHSDLQRVKDVAWNATEQILSFTLVKSQGSTEEALHYRRNRNGWEKLVPATSTAADRAIDLRLVEGPNARPTLNLFDRSSGAMTEILDPNPWLDNFELGQVEAIDWTSPYGSEWEGVLYFPPDYVEGERYPMVILTHGVEKESFSPAGYGRNYAAQPIAARGMVVLQVNETGVDDVLLTPQELPRSREGYESAIDELDRRELIDRNRVGIVGWSRTAWYANYMATHSDYPIAAMMITDGADIGWWSYLNLGAMDEMDVDLGSPPFGKGLEAMLELAPSFSLDRWRAPMLMWSAGEDVLDLWDIYEGLRRLGNPVEYWHFPDGTHDLTKISHRKVGGEMMVDWFDFWLNDHEGEGVGKLEQFRRWRKLRELRAKRSAIPRPPLLDWRVTESAK